MPTKDTSSYKNLGSDEKKLYDRITISFFLIFMPPYEYISTTILTDIANYIFETKGLTVVKPGFKEQVKEDETGEKDINRDGRKRNGSDEGRDYRGINQAAVYRKKREANNIDHSEQRYHRISARNY